MRSWKLYTYATYIGKRFATGVVVGFPYATSTDSVRHQRKLSHPIGLRHQPAGWVGGGIVVVAPSATPAAHFEPCTRYFCCYTQAFGL